MAELVGDAQQCPKCRYSAVVAVAVGEEAAARDPLDEAARQELTELFDIEALHRRGRASLVYLARDLEWKARVVLKVMPRSPEAGAAAQEAFHRAAAAAAALEHVHVVPMYGAGTTDRCFWYATQYVDGPSLAELLRSGPMQLHACLRLVEQIAAALDYAHTRGVVHADLKPANVLVDAAGRARVTDFWVPRVLEQLGALDAGRTARQIEYIGPEEFSGQEPGPYADQYSLAVLAYECLCGNVPFSGDTVETIAEKQRTEPAPRLSDVRPDVPDHVSLALERALRPTPSERHASVVDFVTALEGLATGVPPLVFDPGPVATDEAAPPAPPPLPKRRRVPLDALALAIIGVAGTVAVVSSRWIGRGTAAPGRPAVPTALAESVPVRPDSMLGRGAPQPGAPRVAAVARDTTPPSATRVRAPVTRHPASRRPAAQPGRLFINATPWGQVYLDGVLIGNTPKAGVPVAPGTHRVRVVRDGFAAYDRTIQVGSGQQLRLTDIVLHELKP